MNLELVKMLKKMGYAVLASMLLIMVIKFIDGPNHRLGTFKLSSNSYKQLI